MNINKYSTTRFLKFTLIFTVVLGIVNLISVNTAVGSEGSECFTDKQAVSPTSSSTVGQSNDYIVNANPATDKAEINEKLNVLNKCFGEKIDSSIDTIKEDFQTKLNNSENILDNKNKKNSLIFIDLPILATLLLLWFLTQNKQQKQIKELTKNQNKIISEFNQLSELDNKLSNLDRTSRQIIEKIQDSNQRNIDLEVKLREFLSKQQFNQPINYHNSLNSDTSHLNSIAIVDKISQFVETYNQDKTSLSNRAIATVAETQKSLDQKRLGSSDIVTLGNTLEKKYCVIEEDDDYYLIPHAKININEHNIRTLESLFDCINFSSDNHNFKLVKPAKVSKNNSEFWQLKEKGKLDFSSKVYD